MKQRQEFDFFIYIFSTLFKNWAKQNFRHLIEMCLLKTKYFAFPTWEWEYMQYNEELKLVKLLYEKYQVKKFTFNIQRRLNFI